MSKKTVKSTKSTKTTKTAPVAPAKKADSKSVGNSYDSSKDVVIKEVGTIAVAGRAGDIVVRVVAYGGGKAKLLIARSGVSKKTGEAWFSPKVGRLTGEELDALLPLMTKARKHVA